jgi:hypothetical protein
VNDVTMRAISTRAAAARRRSRELRRASSSQRHLDAERVERRITLEHERFLDVSRPAPDVRI